MSAPSLILRRLCTAAALALAFAYTASLAAQIPTRNVNMVSGLEWPFGDPFMQRQNEPSLAASTRNPMHLLAGANDYRSVDLPIVLSDVDGEVGDAWLGLFKSVDGGERWTSTLLPGYPYDHSPEGQTSPLFGYHAAADPVVRAGTHGLMYYAGLAFDRTPAGSPPGKSAIFVARFIDNNNQEAGDPFRYINTSLVSTSPGGTSNVFLDKPWMAVDIPRQGGGTCAVTTNNEDGPFTQRLPAGNVYVAFTVKSTDAQGDRWDVYFSRSADCGERFSAPVRISRPEDRVNQGATLVIAPTTGAVYVAWRRIDLAADGVEEHAIVVSRSTDMGMKWNPPGVARRFPRGKKLGLDPAHTKNNGKKNTVAAQTDVTELAPFDQGTSAFDIAFRTNAYPTMTADGTGRLYLAWTERGFATHPERSDPFSGDARILLTTSLDGSAWTAPAVVSDYQQQGHQIMPAISFAGGKVMLVYYDLQEDRSGVFAKYIDDRTAFLQSLLGPRRHTIDIRVSMASPGATPVFEPSRSVSSYLHGARTSTSLPEQLQVNPPNLPLFKLGTVPFIGDYIDIAPAPAFVPNGSGGWIYNTAATSTAPVFHVAWTDNRDVKPPPLVNGVRDWTKYTPPTYSGPRPDPLASVIVCDAGYAGGRNQNIYTARVTGGLIVGSPQNSKPLNTEFARAFVVFAKNTTDRLEPRVFRMTILSQPPGGRASFSQFPAPPFTPASPAPLTTIDVTIPRFSSASRTVYVTSTDPAAPITVDVSEIGAVGAPGELPGGLEGTIYLNPDILNPEVDNPEVDNPEVDNPEVDNAEVYNPEVDNPEVDNPEVDNPEVDNPEVDNPEVDNIVVGNPEVDNPEVDNPEVDNPEVDNPEVDNPEVDNSTLLENGGILTDITWKIRNIGNTTTAYNVNLFLRQQSQPSTGTSQLLIYRIYKTPVIKFDSCNVQTVTQNVLLANIPSPTLVFPDGAPSDPNDPGENTATLWIPPMEELRVTLRVFDPDKTNNIIVDGASIDPEWVPEQDVSLIMQPQPVNTPDVDNGVIEPPLVGADPLPILTVTTTADAGAGSLRDAIAKANAQPGVDTIVFNVPGPGPHTIAPASALPAITDPVVIDGSTQPGFTGVPLIELDGTGAGAGVPGLRIESGGSVIRALTINRFDNVGIDMRIGDGNALYGNYIGVDTTGTAARPNGAGGIVSLGPSGNHIIGSAVNADRNLISGNAFNGILLTGAGADNNIVEGNYIGVDVNATAVLGNSANGVFVSGGASNLVHGNVISGNGIGIHFRGSSNTATRNRLGTNPLGTAALPNNIGIMVSDGINNRVGLPGAGNLISGNTSSGILVSRLIVDPVGTEITGNFIGTEATGTIGLGNDVGITLEGTSNVLIGGPGLARNIISGNISDGIRIQRSVIGVVAASNVIKGNHIGVNFDGTGLVSNFANGILVIDSSSNVIGGPLAGEGNVISGNGQGGVFISAGTTAADNNVIAGNRIGTTANGLGSIANFGAGVRVIADAAGGGSAAGTRIGGPNAADGNIISGNSLNGVLLLSLGGVAVTGSTLQNNYIGVGADGTSNWGNGGNGIRISGAAGTLIGGNQATARNIVGGNAFSGILVAESADVNISGNFVGVAVDGLTAVPNSGGGILIAGAGSTNTVIGGAAGFGNVVSGNIGVGVNLSANGSTMTNNYVGIDSSGTVAVPNTTAGVDSFGNSNVIGQPGNGNVVSGNAFSGIRVRGWSTVVQGNKVGTNFLGTAAVANGAGVVTQNRFDVIVDAVIGGEGPGEGNLISGNTGPGIGLSQELVNPGDLNPEIGNPPPWFVEVKGNLIGTAANGIDPIGNGHHGFSAAGVSGAVIGSDNPAAANVIAHNVLGGVAIVDDAHVTVMNSAIHSNVGLDLDLGFNGITANDVNDPDVGPNLLQNFPTVNAVGPQGPNTEISVGFNSTPSSNFTFRVYETAICHPSGNGGGQILRSVRAGSTDATGNGGFVHVFAGPTPSGHFITMTATDAAGNTSEFSNCRQMP